MSNISVCVLRQTREGDQYIPVEDAQIRPGENIYVARFRSETLNDGPSRSHRRRICLPEGKILSLSLSSCYMGAVAPDRDWVSLTAPLAGQNGEKIFVRRRQYLELVS